MRLSQLNWRNTARCAVAGASIEMTNLMSGDSIAAGSSRCARAAVDTITPLAPLWVRI